MHDVNELTSILQRGLAIESRPFAPVAEKMGTTEDNILAQTKELFESGKARRFGAVFNSEALGYQGTLCSVSVPPAELERCATIVSEHTGVTHCYEREHSLNLWFTLTAQKDDFERELAEMFGKIAPYKAHNLPAIKRFKIQVTFNTASSETDNTRSAPTGEADLCALKEGDKDIIRLMQGSIPVCAEPFAWAAAQLGISEEYLLKSLKRLEAGKALKRICIIFRHREIGFTANGMCTWSVDPEKAAKAGALLAECPEVTHCYERVACPTFPFNLFAMVHANSRKAAMEIFEKISKHAGLSGGQVLFSTREFKKASMVYFSEHMKEQE